MENFRSVLSESNKEKINTGPDDIICSLSPLSHIELRETSHLCQSPLLNTTKSPKELLTALQCAILSILHLHHTKKARLLFLKSQCHGTRNNEHSVPGRNRALPPPCSLEKVFHFPAFENPGFSPVTIGNISFSEQQHPPLSFKYGRKRKQMLLAFL